MLAYVIGRDPLLFPLRPTLRLIGLMIMVAGLVVIGALYLLVIATAARLVYRAVRHLV